MTPVIFDWSPMWTGPLKSTPAKYGKFQITGYGTIVNSRPLTDLARTHGDDGDGDSPP